MENKGLTLGKSEQMLLAISTIAKELHLLRQAGIIYEDEPSSFYGRLLLELLEKRYKTFLMERDKP